MPRQLGRLIDHHRGQALGHPTEDGLWVKHENPYLKQAVDLEAHLFTASQCEEKPWDLLFPTTLPLVVEVGCYYGKNLAHMAQQNPNFFFIGLEITYKRAVKSAQRLKKQNLTNAVIVMGRAQEFFLNFPKLCAGVCVFFPDPWPKERQKKHRLINTDFAQLLRQKIQPEGFFWLQTDAHDYALEAKHALSNSGFQCFLEETISPQQKATPPKELPGEPHHTNFQELFHKKNLSTYSQLYRTYAEPNPQDKL